MSMEIKIEDNKNLDKMYQINKIERTSYQGEVDGHKFTYITKSVAIPHRSSLIWQKEGKVPSNIKNKAASRIAKIIAAIKKELRNDSI